MDYIINTIMEQIKWKVLHSKGFRFVRLSDTAMLVLRGNKSLSIEYNEDSDLYNLSKSGAKQLTKAKTKKIKDVRCDRLVEIIAEYFNIKDANYEGSPGNWGNTDSVTCVICGKWIRKGCESFVCGTRVNGPVHRKCLLRKVVEED